MFRESIPEHKHQYIEKLNKQLQNLSAKEIISIINNEFGNKITFATSMGAEDQVITSMISSIAKNMDIITLDTGRLFQETYDLIQTTNSRYGIKIRVIFPDAEKVEEMVSKKGINLFYESIESRKLCCHIRKIEPLIKALKGKEAWITGLRKEQSSERASINLVEWDDTNGLIKVNPLIHWTEDDVWKYIKENNIPHNKLHDKGFKSIGCLPCTKAVKPGEDARSGRWWWENQENKECGLHQK